MNARVEAVDGGVIKGQVGCGGDDIWLRATFDLRHIDVDPALGAKLSAPDVDFEHYFLFLFFGRDFPDLRYIL
jgi:hypothetical protein